MSSTTNTMGIPKLLPVTATFLLPFGLLNTALQIRCIQARMAGSIPLGRDCTTTVSKDPAAARPVAIDGETGDPLIADPMLVASSAHDNFVQNVPLALVMAAAVEANGGDRRVLAGALAAFWLARVAHAVGLHHGRRGIRGRQAGFFGSVAAILGFGAWSLNLVKGYWGY